jgi:hypothetical protein
MNVHKVRTLAFIIAPVNRNSQDQICKTRFAEHVQEKIG